MSKPIYDIVYNEAKREYSCYVTDMFGKRHGPYYGSSQNGVIRKANSDLGIRNVGYGRPKGSKNYVGRPYNEKDIKRLFGHISAAYSGAIIMAKAITMDELAQDMLERTIQSAVYDEYTGNLSASYSAVVIAKRKIVRTLVYRDKVTFGTVHHGKRGGRYVKKRRVTYHGMATSVMDKSKNEKIRYLRKWEIEQGGYGPKFNRNRSKASFNAGYLNRGSGRMQSGVMITNDAPYASAVHRVPNRKVLSNSTAIPAIKGKWGSRYESLVRVASSSILKKAGFRIRK